MQKSTKAKLATAGTAIILAVSSLINSYQNSPTTIVNNNPNVVYIATGANGQEIIGVLDKADVNASLNKRGDIVETSAFIAYDAPPDNPTYLPIIIKKQSVNWPADRSRVGYWRPAPGGVSIGHPKVTAGTLGGRICFEGNCSCFISNAHVMGGLNGAQIGDPILQPGPHDGGVAGDEIGKIVAIVAPRKNVNNVVDVAIACGDESTVYSEIYGIGAVNDVYPEPFIGMTATKCGRSSGCTVLTLIGLDATVKVGYYTGASKLPQTYTFVHQLLWQGKSSPGDSGSEIVTNNLMDALLFAGNDDNQVMSNDLDFIWQSIPGAYLPGMRYQGLIYP
ncbi:MAG: hypothetical protein WC998_01530 [Candidatus Paceibacterota bacterium]|jgi:hypothetical protein